MERKDIVAMLFDEFHGVNHVVCVDKVRHILKVGNLASNNYFGPLFKPYKFSIEYLLPNIDSTIVPQAQIHTRLLQ
jgi:hypothetical protein